LLRGIFDKETRRKALAVVGAAMELRTRLGFGERRDESGNGSRPGVRCEVEVRERGNFATCMQPVMRDKAVVLRLGRRSAKTCWHTFESDWMVAGSGGVGQFASEGQL
jgi:hypothetical protein